MVYETSYESGRKPFRPDVSRGKWERPSDFIYVCLGMALKLDIFSLSWVFFFQLGIAGLLPYLMCVGLYLVPLMVVQFFMGQFSSSGFISSFRISPFFKGMGYVSLGLNIAMLSYYSIFAAVPLLFLFHSFRPTLPWSCEAWKISGHNITESEYTNICNITAHPENHLSTETTIETDSSNETDFSYSQYHLPSVLFFRTHFTNINFNNYETADYEICWELVAFSTLTWAIIALIFYKFNETGKLGRFLRFSFWTTLGLLVICLLRFMFLPGAFNGITGYLTPTVVDWANGLPSVPMYAMAAFGSGWGSLIAVASANKFKTNIMRYSWIIAFGQMAVFVAFGMVSYMLDEHFETIIVNGYSAYVERHWVLYLSSGSAIASMSLANLWSLLFYSMLLLAALIVMVTQIFTILISVFDDFDTLRYYKQEVTFGFIGAMALISVYFCSNHGILQFVALSADSLFTQTALHLLLILVVLWIYGRDRFQRDIEFMLSQRFVTWKVNVLRFVAPLALLLTLLISVVVAFYEHLFSSTIILIIALFLVVIPWLFVPCYGIFIMSKTMGHWKDRFKRACRPTDWYPVESEDRQRYEESVGNMDITHQLHEVHDEVL